MPLAFILALVFASQGVIQNLHGTTVAHTVEHAVQVIPGGPIASQEAIKELGTNGGGFLNANSAHPFENPNGLTNLLQIASLLLIPFALTYAFGRMVKDQKQGWVLFGAMFVLWIARGRSGHGGRGARQPPAHFSAAPTRRPPPPSRAATWRARTPASDRPPAGCIAGLDDGHVHRRHQLPARQPHRRWGAWPRW